MITSTVALKVQRMALVLAPATWKISSRDSRRVLLEPATLWEHAHYTMDYAFNAEEKELTGALVKLSAETKQEAIRVVQRLHRNLGHPSPTTLTELLASRGASEAAQSYKCLACAKYKKPNDAAPAATQKAQNFNEIVQADVFWTRRGSTKYAIMSMVDMATRYTAACLLRSERSEEYIKALERFWIAHFGVPGLLMTDEGRPWLSGIMDEWTSAHGMQHKVAPGEAHERLAIVERRHALIRKAVEIYLDDVKVDHVEGIKEALTFVVPQLNATPIVAGFSPSQWVLGYQPSLAGDLSDAVQPSHFGGNASLEDIQQASRCQEGPSGR